MSFHVAPPLRTIFALTATFALLFTTVSILGAAGAQEPTVVIDAETPGGPRVTSGGPVEFNETRNLQLTNLTAEGNRVIGATFHLIAPPTSSPTDSRTATSSGNGKLSVTFPSVTFGDVGNWTITGPDDFSAVFTVEPSHTLVVTLSQSEFEETSSFVIFTAHVADEATGAPVGGATIEFDPPGPVGGRTNTAGNYTYFGPIPGVGRHVVRAGLDVRGDGSPERTGTATVTVTPSRTLTFTPSVAGSTITSLTVRGAIDAGTENVAAGTHPLTVSLANATGHHPTSAEGFSKNDIIISGAVLPGWRVTSYDEATGNAELAGLVPTTQGAHVKISADWLGKTSSLDLLVQNGGRLSASYATIDAQTETSVTFHLADAYGNPVSDGKVSLFRGQQGAYPGIAPTILNGTGAPGAGKDGNYTFRITPEISGSLTAFAQIGRQQGGLDNRNFSYLPITVARVTPSVEIDNVTLGALTTRNVSVRLHATEDFGTATVTLHYDPTSVHVESVTEGNLSASTFVSHHDPANGTLRMLVLSSNVPGPNGDFTVATLTLRATGTLGTVSNLHLTVEEFTDSEGQALNYTIKDGSARLGILGDINGDDLVTKLDVTAASEYAIGARDATGLTLSLGDVNRDGGVTGIDAMFIAQILAGTRGSF